MKEYLEQTEEIVNYLRPVFWDSCPHWVQNNIDLSLDNTCAIDGLVDLSFTPYMTEPLCFWERDYRSKMTVVAIEQTGKSSIWKWGLLYKHEHMPLPSLIVYPSDADAADTNQDSFRPLMTGIPKFALELERPRMERKDCFRFSSSPIYFNGGGADIISKPLGVVIGDEVDFWTQHFEQVDNIKNLDKRTRSFYNSLRVLVCSINQKRAKRSIIWEEFSLSSQGFWHLFCPTCGKPNIRSCDIINLQWDNYDNGDVIEESIRLMCPFCKTRYAEDRKREMNIQGRYIHNHPDRIKNHVGFQWGGLASQMPGIKWIDIANAQTAAGRSNSLEAKLLLYNSFMGLPLDMKVSDPLKQLLQSHIAELPDPKTLEAVFMMADTQDDCFYYRIRAIDSNMNSYSLTPDIKANTFEDLERAWQSEYLGIKPVMGIIDVGGHRPYDVEKWIEGKRHFYGYRGSSKVQQDYIWVENKPKILLADPYPYQQDLLYHMYNQLDRSNNYWYLHPKESEDYFRQMLDVRSSKNESQEQTQPYAKWTSITRYDHVFDCEKMFFLLLKLAKRKLQPSDWRLGKIKGTAIARPTVKIAAPSNSFFNGGGFGPTSFF